jgi:protein SCO1
VLLVLAGGWLWLLGDGAPRAPLGWQLIDGRGQTVTAQDLPGKFLLVYFGYTNCPDICPTALQSMTAALGKLGPAGARL